MEQTEFSAALQQEALTPEQRTALQQAMQSLLRWQVSRYTMDERGSIPEELAVTLAQSLWYTVCRAGEPVLQLAAADPQKMREIYHAGLRQLQKDRGKTQLLCKAVMAGVPPFASDALRETVADIASGLNSCDLEFFARQLNATIDYQLCQPVDEALAGIDYAAEYLRRLDTENALLASFEPALCERLLSAWYPDYSETPLNLCEPVLSTAAGCVLAGKNPALLSVTRQDRALLAFSLSQKKDLQKELKKAAAALCTHMGWKSPVQREYVAKTLAELEGRLRLTPSEKGLRGVFIPLF